MENNTDMQLVSFKVGKEHYAGNIHGIQEIIRLTKIVSIPESVEFVEGVINLRGRVIPVIDLAKRFDMPATRDDSRSRIIITETDKIVVGFIVDEVLEVLRVETQSFEETPTVVSSVRQQFIQGLIKSDDLIYVVLNFDGILSQGEEETLEKVA